MSEQMTRYKKYKKSYQAYYHANRERIQEMQRQWREANRTYNLERQRRWRQAHPNFRQKYEENNPEKVKAWKLVGRQPLGHVCEFCGTIENLEHGHIDYVFPRLYLTVCRRCNIWMDRDKVEVKQNDNRKATC